jgi:hypothetical protein
LFEKEDVVVRSERLGEVSCLFTYRKAAKNNWELSVWQSERDEYNPVRFLEKFEVDGVPEARTTEIEWQQTPGDFLFIKHLKHNTMISVGGTKIACEEVVAVHHADFESAIDPTVFTVAGFGLNENQVIGYPELKAEDQPRWRNGKVDYSETAAKQAPAGNSAAPQSTAPYPVESNLSSFIGMIAGVLAVVTAITALVLRRRRAAA